MTLKDLEIGATLDRKGLIVRGPVLDGLNVTLAEAPPADEAAKPAASKTAKAQGATKAKADPKESETAKAKPEAAAPIALPEIRLPFPIQLEGLAATRVRYQQGELIEGLDKLLLSARAQDARIDVRELSLRHAMADLVLKGHATPVSYTHLTLPTKRIV